MKPYLKSLPKIGIYIFIVNILFLFSCTNKQIRNDLFDNNLKGQVKRVITYNYDASDKFGEIHKGEFFSQHIDSFDVDGHCVNTIISIPRWKVSVIIKASFNSVGQISEHVSYDSSGSVTYKRIYEYDKSGNKVKESSYFPDTLYKVIKYKYDELNNRILEQSYNSNGSLYYTKSYMYNLNKRPIKITSPDDYVGGSEDSFSYDSKNNVITELNRFNKDDDTYSSEDKYTYKKFDNQDNWLYRETSSRYKQEETKYSVEERKIEYY